MYNLKPIYKSALSVLVKMAVLTATAYFIFNRLGAHKALNESFFYNNLENIFIKNGELFIAIFMMSIANWMLEIFKWQFLVETVNKISFKTAAKQCFSALTASLFTPNRMGDYVAKSLYFNKNNIKKIVALNAVGHGWQLVVTVFFGLFGGAYISLKYPIKFASNLKIILLILVFILLVFSLKTVRILLIKLLQFYKHLPLKLFIKTGVLSVLRYLIFSHQYYLLLLLFGLQVDYFTTMAAIFTMYLLASILPSLSLTDWVVKGSAAVFIFGFLEVAALLVLQVSLLMWFFNFALPAMIGSFYVVKFRINQPKPIVTHL